MSEIYTPSNSLTTRIGRVMSRYLHKQIIAPKLDQPIISFTFDDCPKSVVENALPLLEAQGWRSTLYMACGLCDTTNHLGLHMNTADIKAAFDNGHEIGDHTFGHLDCTAVSSDEFQADINKNQSALSDIGIPESRTFAYPYGAVKPATKKAMSKRFELSRGVRTSHDASLDMGLTNSTRLYHGEAVNEAIHRIKAMTDNPKWDILFTHDVRDNPSDYGCTVNDLKATIKAVKDSGAIVLPVAEALDLVRAAA